MAEHAPWPVKRCLECGLVYLDEAADQHAFVNEAAGQLGESASAKTVEYWSFPQMYQRHRAVFHGYFQERLERLRRYHPGLGRVLDIGCGFGFFMDYLRQHGLACAGLDIDPASVRYAQNTLGLDHVRLSSFEDYQAPGKFDGLAACDVLEHVAEPNGFLQKCRGLLNPGGVVYIQVPNVLGDVLPAGGSYNWPYHLWQFDPATLERLMRHNGYEVLDWWTGVMGVIGVYEAGGPDAATKNLWRQAASEKRGNRLAMLVKIHE